MIPVLVLWWLWPGIVYVWLVTLLVVLAILLAVLLLVGFGWFLPAFLVALD